MDFITKFKSLDGLTIAQRRKNFFILLHQNSTLKNDPDALNQIVENLTPTTYLEELFHLEFLIYFRRTEELRNMLKEGNDVFISKIARQGWFFKEAFGNTSANELVNEVLPTMSFSIRMKVLKKLSRYLPDAKFDDVFDAVNARYGKFRAKHFITGCTPQKIRQIISSDKIKLTSSQLRILYGKDPEFIKFYFDQGNYYISDGSYRKLLRFLFEKNRPLFDYFQNKYEFSFRFGRRASKKFIDLKKDEIIRNARAFDYLHMTTVLRKLGKESVMLFKNALPDQFKHFYLGHWSMQIFPRRYHYNLCFNIVPAHYNIKFTDHPKFINVELLKLTRDQTHRVFLAQVKVDLGNDDYIKYLTTQNSVPLIKEKINLRSDIHERSELVKELIESCHINKDITALYAVMKYFCFRHKNDDVSVHLQFIYNIENLFGFKEFTEQMWDLLNELLLIHVLKYRQNSETFKKIQTRPILSFNIGVSHKQQLSYLEFLFKKGVSIDEYITDYFQHNSWPQWDEYDKDFCKHFLLYAINTCTRKIEKEEDVHYNSSFIDAISSFTKRYKDENLSLFDFGILVDTFLYSIKNICPRYGNVYKIFISKIFTTERNDEYLKIYLDNIIHYVQQTDIEWFFRHDPLILVKNFDLIFNVLLEKHYIDIYFIVKKFSHLELNLNLILMCLSKLKSDTGFDLKLKVITCLAIILRPEEYSDLADSYKPESRKLDLKNEKDIRLYNTQLAIAEEFRRIKSYKVLKSLLNYSIGDYLSKALGSLYSIMYRTPENLLPEYLDYLSKQAVSVRKHALFLACELTTPQRVENMIRLLNQEERVLSLQKHMFSATMKYFLKNPSDEYFELVKANMTFISKEDEESLRNIESSVSNIPMEYRPQYIQYSWEFLEKIINVWSKLKTLKISLLHSMDEKVIAELPLDFLLRIIQEHYLTEKRTKDLSYVIPFMYRVVKIKEDKPRIFAIIFTILDQCQDLPEIFEFLTSWYDLVMKSKDYNYKYLVPYVDYYENKISNNDFSHFVKLFFLRIKVGSSEKPSREDLAKHVTAFFKDLLSKYGPYITQIFAKNVRSNLTFFTVKTIEVYEIYYCMIKNYPDPHMGMLLLQILPEQEYSGENISMFVKILDQIKNLNDKCIDLYLYPKFKHYSNSRQCSSR